jgi:hypothetical protein
MTGPGSNERFEALLKSLPRAVEPGRDLWPEVAAQLEPRSSRQRQAWAWRVAAVVALVAASSLITAALMRHDAWTTARLATPATTAPVVPAAFGQAQGLGVGYEAARRQLAADLRQRLAGMPPSARQKLVANLAEMHRAAAEINTALARQPGDPLLEELLLNTYQDELGVLASVNQLTSTGVAFVPARKEKVRL